MIVRRIISGCTVILLIVSCGRNQTAIPGQQQAQPADYPTAIVHTQDTIVYTEYPAIIRGQEDIEIKPRVDGFIEAIYVDEGAVVRRGQRLFSINSPQTVQMLTTAQQTLISAQTQVNTAKLNVDRMRPLAEKGIISNVQLQTLQNSYEAALATQAQAEAQLSSARAMSDWLNVSSPVDGVIGTIPYRQGSLVSSANVLTTVANTENIYAYFSLNEKNLMDFLADLPGRTDAERIQQIPAVTLILADGSIYPEQGRIETISGVVDVSTGSASLRARFPNTQGLLRSGTSGRVQIPQVLQNVMVIPQKATFSIQDRTLVYRVQGDSVVQKVVDVVPIPGGQDYAVTGGLQEGERIAVDGIATLSHGQKIIVR